MDCFLESFINNIRFPTNYELAVVYHTTGEHKHGYEKLIKKYSNEKLKFYERSTSNYCFFYILKYLFSPINMYRFVKYAYLRKNVDDFKFLVEKIITSSKAEFLMFSTDDTFYDGEIVISEQIFHIIKNNPYKYLYRLYLGENLIAKYKALAYKRDGYLEWNFIKIRVEDHGEEYLLLMERFIIRQLY